MDPQKTSKQNKRFGSFMWHPKGGWDILENRKGWFMRRLVALGVEILEYAGQLFLTTCMKGMGVLFTETSGVE